MNVPPLKVFYEIGRIPRPSELLVDQQCFNATDLTLFMKTKYNEIKPVSASPLLIKQLLDAKVEWQGEWDDIKYMKNDMVKDGSWTMIANKDTYDRAAPQAVGNAEYIYDGTLTPTSTSGKFVTVGARYTLLQAGWLSGYRIFTEIGNTYSVFSVNRGTGVITQRLILSGVIEGWHTVPIDPILAPEGTEFDLVMRVTNNGTTTVDTDAQYSYSTPNNEAVPDLGEIVHATKAIERLDISKTDAVSGDRSALLEALLPGDTIAQGSLVWTITSSVDNGTYMSFNITPPTQGTAGTSTFTFTTVTAAPIDYEVDSLYYQSISNIKGLFGVDDAYEDLQVNDNAYGVDILYQEAFVSEDWDVVAESSSGAMAADYVKETVLFDDDIDNLVTSGFYRINANHGQPIDISYGQVIVSRGGDTVFQIAGNYSGRAWFRNGNPSETGGTGVWSSWSELGTSTNVVHTMSEQDYLPITVSGGKPSRAEIITALTAEGIVPPYPSGQTILIDGSKSWLGTYVSSVDKFFTVKLTEA